MEKIRISDIIVTDEVLADAGVQRLNTLLARGQEMSGADVHLMTGSVPKVRVRGELIELTLERGGVLYGFAELDDSEISSMLMPLMDAYARTEYGSKGQWDLSYGTRDGTRYRVNIYRQKGSGAGVFRILPKNIPELESLALPQNVVDLYTRRRGLTLVTGVTGSGKSTTLAALMRLINERSRKHIITLEDPIEYMHWSALCNISQREIGTDVTRFADGLRAALREDPDVIMVGEMRDRETVEIGIEAAETGHYVLSTLHTMGASETVTRLSGMFGFEEQHQILGRLSSALDTVISQQLLPKVDGGYALALEVLHCNKDVKRMIVKGMPAEIEDYMRSPEGRAGGLCTMDDSIKSLYKSGEITAETAVSYAVDRTNMERYVLC